VARERRGRCYWSNGGTEIELGRESAAQLAEHPKALVVYETRALGVGQRKTRIVATCASPVRLSVLVRAGLGRERVAHVKLHQGRLLARIERVFARKVIARRDQEPEGSLAREAVAKLVLDGALFRGAAEQARERLREMAFLPWLPRRLRDEYGITGVPTPLPIALADWLTERLAELGLESAADIPLLSTGDLVPPSLAPDLAELVDHHFPHELAAGGARYDVEYDLQARQVTLRWKAGHSGRCPERSSLPAFAGFSIRVDTGRGSQRLR
jgi:hypothetical protein